MEALPILQELQLAHDGLRTIQRDLRALPDDMVRLEASAKAAGKRIQETEKKILQAKAQLGEAEKELKQAAKAEEWARKDLKASAHKVQYTAAMRALEEKERQIEAAQRKAAELQAALKSLEEEMESLVSSQREDQRQFDELHEIFLSEHENQVVGQGRLTEQIAELEQKLDEALRTKFNRLLQGRNGRAVVPMENDVCTGCNTKLRTPLIYKLRAEGSVACESCQRILFLPK
jgi:predicted  nucleic acid-binding Zn-ribbon protein